MNFGEIGVRPWEINRLTVEEFDGLVAAFERQAEEIENARR